MHTYAVSTRQYWSHPGVPTVCIYIHTHTRSKCCYAALALWPFKTAGKQESVLTKSTNSVAFRIWLWRLMYQHGPTWTNMDQHMILIKRTCLHLWSLRVAQAQRCPTYWVSSPIPMWILPASWQQNLIDRGVGMHCTSLVLSTTEQERKKIPFVHCPISQHGVVSKLRTHLLLSHDAFS